MFQVPSTPDSRRRDSDIPSTTPAGPPPTSFTHQSFTPAGQPPSSVLGSSFGPGNGLPSKPFSFSQFVNSPSNRAPAPSHRVPSKGFAVPSSSPPRASSDDIVGGHVLSRDEAANILAGGFGGPMKSANLALDSIEDMLDFGPSPRGAKRSRNGDVMAQSMRSSRRFGDDLNRDPTMPGVVNGLLASMPKVSLTESDALILSTESILESLESAIKSGRDDANDIALQQAVLRLHGEWSKHKKYETVSASIGPSDKSQFSRAAYVASLLFQIHDPISLDTPSQERPSTFTSLIRNPSDPVPHPQALLSWLNKNHNPFPEDLLEVQSYRPSPVAHERFWDTIFQTLLRGHISTVASLLSTADWTKADTALEDGYPEPGYTGSQLAAVQHVITGCVTLLRSCPALTDDDWAVTSTSWALFRTRARRALDELEAYAEDSPAYVPTNIFSASTFAAGSRRAESRVPWTIREQLKAVYGQILGYKEEILLSAQDWLEACVYLAVWWDGEDERDLSASRRGAPGRSRERLVDVDPVAAYQRRLLGAFAAVTDEPEDSALEVNTVDAVQVGIAAVLEGETESALRLIAQWSLVAAAAVAEVADVGGWLPQSGTRDMMEGFDADDLMVLSHGNVKKEGLDRDAVLVGFAGLLAERDELQAGDGKMQDGWEVAVRVLARLDSASKAQTEIGNVFDGITLESAEQVDQALQVCGDLGLDAQARTISARYANKLTESSHSYGEAMLYFARAHSTKELQSTLDLLLSTSLARSSAYPPTSELDPKLAELLGDQVRVVSRLARIDVEAARLLATKLSGYAALRRFYELRDEDEEDDEAEGEDEEMADDGERESATSGRKKKSGLRPAQKRKEMVKAIVALVDSAGESIRGGLFDAASAGVVQVDALLALLGEAMGLLHQPQYAFSKRQLMTILRATEDLQTVSSRIYEQSEALFQACMGAYTGAIASNPQDLAKSLQLHKSTSNLSGSTYGMVNSRGSIESEKTNGTGKGSETEDGIKRAWDWRRGIAMTMGKNAKGADVLRILRVGIAKEIGRGWIEGR
ncbi:hypothetical protein CAC42_7013 [Sphaceloma murrayae]|uniref:Nuclear pore complex protein Nup85 n=1 Tax=Sphaceloma murrayae TaxID=2082308 RepID=A0A2K1QQW0_9PEZI|nr:hypothetical protein CAC42_7013 [Sphaceloma murrayae]